MLHLLATRRSVAPLQMTGPAPSPDDVTTLLRIASRVPDHGKLAPWRFIVFADEARARAGDVFARIHQARHPDASEDSLRTERARFTGTPLVIAIVSRAAPHPKIPQWEQELSAGAVCMSLIIAANAMGYATKWLTEWMAFDRDVANAFGLAPHERIAGFVHIGRASEKPAERERPSLADIVTAF